MEEATFLTRFADKVYVIHRKDTLRASQVMQDRAFADPKIEFLWNNEVAHIYGDESVDGIGLVDTVDGTETTLDVSGLFVAIGADPRTHLVHGQLDLTTEGTIAVEGRSLAHQPARRLRRRRRHRPDLPAGRHRRRLRHRRRPRRRALPRRRSATQRRCGRARDRAAALAASV